MRDQAGHTNGSSTNGLRSQRAAEVSKLLQIVQEKTTAWIAEADKGSALRDDGSKRPSLVDPHPPAELKKLLGLRIDEDPLAKQEFYGLIDKIFKYSVNTWDQGFMDKLYASTNAVGLASEQLLSALNTNVHVYQVSPVLTLIEKHTTEALANLFGFTGRYAGGISQPGGSASNSTSIIVARNTIFPRTKENGLEGRRFVLFTSAHGHYSLEKAAQMFGFGSKAVRSVPVDEDGQMIPSELDKMIHIARDAGETPFYVNATAGTTVLGSYDPFDEIADICQRHKLYMHVDASWGGSVVFSDKFRSTRLKGVERADSIAFNPHKLLAVPLTCSFLLAKNLRQFWQALTLPAGYLFHNDAGGTPDPAELYDLADLTPQCGRRGDSLKMYMSWVYHGTSGLRNLVEGAFDTAMYLLEIIKHSPDLSIVSPDPQPCTQVCLYYTPAGQRVSEEETSKITQDIAKELVNEGFLIDYAPGPHGKMLRIVVGVYTERKTVERLARSIVEIGQRSSGS